MCLLTQGECVRVDSWSVDKKGIGWSDQDGTFWWECHILCWGPGTTLPEATSPLTYLQNIRQSH